MNIANRHPVVTPLKFAVINTANVNKISWKAQCAAKLKANDYLIYDTINVCHDFNDVKLGYGLFTFV